MRPSYNTHHPLAVTLFALLAIILIGTPATQAQTPTVSIQGPNVALLGETFSFSISTENTDTSTIGFDPIVELILPALPANPINLDPEVEVTTAFPEAPTLALSLQEATYLGNPIYTQFIGHFSEETGTIINPITQQEVTGTPRDGLYILHYPLSSIAPDQPAATIEVQTKVHALAPIESRTLNATAIFNFGSDPTGQSNPLIGPTVTSNMSPSLLQLRKTISYPESETATGPNFPGTWKLIGISRFGLRQQVVDIESKLIADFHRPLVAYVLIDRRVSLQVGSVE